MAPSISWRIAKVFISNSKLSKFWSNIIPNVVIQKIQWEKEAKLILSLLKHSFDIIGISEHKITKSLKKSTFNIPGYTFCFNETETSDGGTSFFVFNNLTYKLQADLLINGHSRLESSTVLNWFFQTKKILSGVPFISIPIWKQVTLIMNT